MNTRVLFFFSNVLNATAETIYSFCNCSNILSGIKREKIKTIISHPLGWLTTTFPTCTLHNSCSHLHQPRQSHTVDTSDVSLMAFHAGKVTDWRITAKLQLSASVSPEWFLFIKRPYFISKVLYILSLRLSSRKTICAASLLFSYTLARGKSAWLTRSGPADWLISWIIISRSATTATAPLSWWVRFHQLWANV